MTQYSDTVSELLNAMIFADYKPLVVQGTSVTVQQALSYLESNEPTDEQLRILSSTMPNFIDLQLPLPHYHG